MCANEQILIEKTSCLSGTAVGGAVPYITKFRDKIEQIF